MPDGELEFRCPNGWVVEEAPPLPPVSDDAFDRLRVENEADGAAVDGSTLGGTWDGERLNVGWAIDMLHPLAARY